MQEFSYAHKDTFTPERVSRTMTVNHPKFSPLVEQLREEASKREIPISSPETLQFTTMQAVACGARRVLEIGTAIGVWGITLLQRLPNAQLVTIEKNQEFYEEAKANFHKAGVEERITSLLGDAGELIQTLTGEFDFIFLDSAKVQYIKYLPTLKKLLKVGGVLLADDVLLYGYVNGEVPTPPKRKMLVQHIKEYIDATAEDEELYSTVLDVGDGIVMSIKKDITNE